jgi:amino-acid N-acetyltransferase
VAQTQDYVKWFRHSTPYINRHSDKTFVVMLPGEAITHANFHNIVHDIALLCSLDVKLVLVHGARPQIDERLQLADTYSHFHKRMRITDSESLPLVIEAIGTARTTLEAALSTGLPNSPMHDADMQVISGNFVVAMPYGVIDGIDFQHTGKVRKVNTQSLKNVLDTGAVVLISPIGYSPTGEIFNLSFSEVATHIASAIKADKLLAFIEGEGIKDAYDNLIRQLSISECKDYLANHGEKMQHDEQQALSACYLSCLQGVQRAQLMSYTTDGALLTELFTRDGLGTLVYSGYYEQLRKAKIEDVAGILDLIRPLEEAGILVRRSRELLETEISTSWKKMAVLSPVLHFIPMVIPVNFLASPLTPITATAAELLLCYNKWKTMPAKMAYINYFYSPPKPPTGLSNKVLPKAKSTIYRLANKSFTTIKESRRFL